MFDPKVKIDKELYAKLKRAAEVAGYSSVDEFIIHVLEREVSKLGGDEATDEEIRKKLEGLGYIS
jgi:hypothetical protein